MHARKKLFATITVTAEEEQELIRAAQAGDTVAQSTLLAAQEPGLLKLAHSMVRGRKGMDIQDLLQAGRLALLEAIQKYDPSRGARLWTSAQWSIREALNAELTADSLPVSVDSRSVRVYLKAKDLEVPGVRVRESGEVVQTMEPTTPAQQRAWATSPDRGNARLSKETYDRLYMMLENNHPVTTGEDDDDDEGGQAPVGLKAIDVQATDGVEAQALGNEERRRLYEALDGLEPRLREMVTRYYGFAGEPETLAEIGAALGMDKSNVSRSLKRASVILREVLGDWG